MKNKIIENLLLILISTSFIAGVSSCKYFRKDKEPQVGSQIPLRDTIPVHDTVYVETEVEVQVPVEIIRENIVYKEIEKNIDTLSIISVYLQKKAILDTLKLEYGYVSVIDTVSGNAIVSRKFTPKIKVPFEEKIVYEEKEPEPSFYIGINGGIDKPNYVYNLGTSLFYQTPRSGMYQVGVGVWNQTSDGINGKFVPYITGGYYWRINLKSKKEK